MSDYEPAQSFWTPQQRECFEKLLPCERMCVWMEPRTGKSKIVVDKACYYFERPNHPLHITGLLIISFPNGVHRGWVTDALPDNVPSRIKWCALVWRQDRCRHKAFRQSLDELLRFKGLRVLSINVEAIQYEECRAAMAAFLKACGRSFLVFDESSALVNGSTLRFEIMANLGAARRYVAMMANLDGTPVDRKGPLDYWAQVGWMGHDILGYPNEAEFRKRFAVIVTRGTRPFWQRVATIREEKIKGGLAKDVAQEVAVRLAKRGRDSKRGRDWWTEVAEQNGMPLYRNMDEIWRKLEPISYRATFQECFPDSERHVYQKRYFQLTATQRRVYEDLRQYYRAQVGDAEIKADHPLTRKLRAQQVTSNYHPSLDTLRICERCEGNGCEACGDTGAVESRLPMTIIDPACNPRLDALEVELRYGKPCVVWCRFRQDVEFVLERASLLGIRACRYDGAAGHDEKADAREGFQTGRYDLIAGNELSLSRGVPLHRAELMVAYSNLFSYRTRRQVEERASHGAKKHAVAVVDLVAEDTVDDEDIIPALRQGLDVSTWVMRDERRQWI